MKRVDALVLAERLLAHLAQELAQARAVREVVAGGLPRRVGRDDLGVREVEIFGVLQERRASVSEPLETEAKE